jgi:hypothetical protein
MVRHIAGHCWCGSPNYRHVHLYPGRTNFAKLHYFHNGFINILFKLGITLVF